MPRVFEVTGALHGRYIVTSKMKTLATQWVWRVTQLSCSLPASLIEALGAFGVAFHDRAMPTDRVFYGKA